MKSFEVQEIKPLQKYREIQHKPENDILELGISLSDPMQQNEGCISYINEKIQQSELDNYFIQCS